MISIFIDIARIFFRYIEISRIKIGRIKISRKLSVDFFDPQKGILNVISLTFALLVWAHDALILIPRASCVRHGACVLQCFKCIWPVLRVTFVYLSSHHPWHAHGTQRLPVLLVVVRMMFVFAWFLSALLRV